MANSREDRQKSGKQNHMGNGGSLDNFVEVSSCQIKRYSRKGQPIFLGIMTPVKEQVLLANSDVNPAIKTVTVQGKEEKIDCSEFSRNYVTHFR